MLATNILLVIVSTLLLATTIIYTRAMWLYTKSTERLEKTARLNFVFSLYDSIRVKNDPWGEKAKVTGDKEVFRGKVKTMTKKLFEDLFDEEFGDESKE